ncbi:hypothetical protein [Mycoplana dimorpha]|uniref:Uncharacterized protein n=1 Tax=Mycoplana dimorpha TaxID=28320 RepID=A0A2T5B5A2_MYCDI|nr:hypothetical protein [Mycoplana dimorpha]PTM94166.1 hypothetical protein C7449_10565 [Mycoplana dimorpha]
MTAAHDQLNVQYDPASRTALLQYGSRSTVLRDLPTREAAEAAARRFAITNWGYFDGAHERNRPRDDPFTSHG